MGSSVNRCQRVSDIREERRDDEHLFLSNVKSIARFVEHIAMELSLGTRTQSFGSTDEIVALAPDGRKVVDAADGRRESMNARSMLTMEMPVSL